MAAVYERMKLKCCAENAVVSGFLRVVTNGCFYLPPSLILPSVELSIRVGEESVLFTRIGC